MLFRQRSRATRRPSRAKLTLEYLEDRLAPADGIVPHGAPQINGSAGVQLSNVTVATFDDVNPSDPLGGPGSAWEAKISWGDGAVDMKVPSTPVSGNTFAFLGTHTYASAGSFTITVNMGIPHTGIGNQNVVTTPVVISAVPQLQSISVTPNSPSIAKGLTKQFTATGTFSDNSQQDLTSQVTWGSTNQAVATINATGLATAVSAGGSTISALMNGISGSTILTVTAPAATQLALSNLTTTSVTAGNTATFTITAKDSGGVTVTGYTGTVSLTSTDPSAQFGAQTLPQTYTFVPTDNGVHSFTVTLKTAGTRSVTVTDQANVSLTATTGAITVNPGPFSKFMVNVLGGNTLAAGNSFLLTAQAADSFGNTVASYTGPTNITITAAPADPQSNFPVSGSLNASTGFGFFLGNFKTAGTYTLSANAGGFTGASAPVTVNPSFASYFTVAVPSTAITGTPISVTVKALDLYNNVATGYAGHVHFTSSDAAAVLPVDPTLTNGQGVFSATLKSAGSQTITGTDTVSTQPTITGVSAPIVTRGLTVSALTPTATGFTVNFSKPFDPSKVTMYGPGAAIQDVVLTGANTGQITGTLLFDATNTTATFKATALPLDFVNNGLNGGPDSVVLPDDVYSVTLQSGAASNGFLDLLGASLDGAGNGGHANYTSTFTTHFQANATPVLGVPDFARGPDNNSTIKVPNSTAHGIPVTLYNATAVKDVVFTVTFNPTILAITGATVLDATGAGSALTLTSSTANSATFTFHNNTTQSGNVVLGDIVANVPDSAKTSYKVKELLQLSAVTVNGAAFTGVTAPGVHVNAYFGDVSGDGAIGAADVNPMFSVSVGTATGFNAFSLTDPAVVGDVAGDISVDGGDVAMLKSFILHLPRPLIPTPPGLTGITSPSPADPALSLAAGSSLVSVMIDDPHPVGSTGLSSAIVALTYDPSTVTVSSADITLGSIPAGGSGWQIVSHIDATNGLIAIELYSSTPIVSPDSGSLVNIALHTSAGTPQAGLQVHLVDAVHIGGQTYGTALADTQGGLVVSLIDAAFAQWA